MSETNTVLVTGSAGRIGRAVVAELRTRGIPVRGFDREQTVGLDDQVTGDLVDPAALKRAVEGARTVIHLAATPDDEDFLSRLLPNNIIGIYHLMEAARMAGVRRLILASSGQVNWWQRMRGHLPVRAEDPPSPHYWYAATKLFMEAIGRSYAEYHQISVIVVRLGWCPRTPKQLEEIEELDWGKEVYLSPGDAGRFLACAAEATANIRFAILYATSKPMRRVYYDLEPAKKLIGYVPRDQWPQGAEVVLREPGE